MRKYEIMFIVRADIEENLIKETAKSFEKLLTDMKSKILESKDMGQKKLAYEIKKVSNGHYYLLNVLAPMEAINEFDRKALLDENVLRHLIIKLDEE